MPTKAKSTLGAVETHADAFDDSGVPAEEAAQPSKQRRSTAMLADVANLLTAGEDASALIAGSSPALADASASLRQLIAAAQADALSLALDVTDEEDAVLLYRCTALAERSPLFLEAVDHRRRAIDQALTSGFERIWGGLAARAQAALDQFSQTSNASFRGRLHERKAQWDESMRVSREAEAHRKRHLRTELEAGQRGALKSQRDQLVCGYEEALAKGRAAHETEVRHSICQHRILAHSCRPGQES